MLSTLLWTSESIVPPCSALGSGRRSDRIFRKADEPETGSEASKKSDGTANGEQQKMGSEEKKGEIKSSEQQP